MPLVRNTGRRRGNAAIEFALILPVFFLLLIGMFEMSWMFFQRASVIAATREGCRSAAVIPDKAFQQAYAQTKIDENLSRYGINCGGAQACDIPAPTFDGLVPRETMRCEVTVEFRSLTGLIPVPPDMFAVNEVLREAQ